MEVVFSEGEVIPVEVDDFVTVSDDDSLDFDNDTVNGGFTVSFWVKTIESDLTDMVVKFSAWKWYLVRVRVDGSLWVEAVNADDSPNTWLRTVVEGYDLCDGGWHFIVCVYSWADSCIYVYVDNVLVGIKYEVTLGTGNISNSGDFLVGDDVLAGAFFGGSVDDLRVFNRTLSVVEVGDLFDYVDSPTLSDVYNVAGFAGVLGLCGCLLIAGVVVRRRG